MNCADCGGDSQVVDSRTREDHVTRRRRCIECGHRWSTWEIRSKKLAMLRRSLREAAKFLDKFNDVGRHGE